MSQRRCQFSVIVPLYNKRDSVAATVASILAQRRVELELIVVDDGSTDGSAEQLAAVTDPRLRLLRQANGGVSRARNAGLAAARYDYVSFIDADDLWEPDFLTEIERLIEHYPEAGIYATRYQLQHSDGRRVPAIKHLPEKETALLNNYFAISGSGPPLIATGASCCFPTAAARAAGGFPPGEKLGEDQELWCNIALRYPVAFSRKLGAVYDVSQDERATARHIPGGELPFSRRLQAKLDNGSIPERLRDDVRRYIAGHLVYVGALNVRAGRFGVARRVLFDRRCRPRQMRRIAWLAVSYWRQTAQLFRNVAGRSGGVAAR